MTSIRRRDDFASDNTAGVCPEALAALEAANSGAAAAYGEDALTAEVCDRVREIFETDCDVYFVFNGTAANALALAQLASRFIALSVTNSPIFRPMSVARRNFSAAAPNCFWWMATTERSR